MYSSKFSPAAITFAPGNILRRRACSGYACAAVIDSSQRSYFVSRTLGACGVVSCGERGIISVCGRSGIHRVISAAPSAVCHTNVDHLQTVVVREIDRITLAIQVSIEADRIGNAAAEGIFLRESIHLRLVEPCAEVDHSRRGVVVFSVVAEAAGCFADLLPKRGVALAGDVFPRQSSTEGVPGVIVADLRSHASSAVVNILRAGASGDHGNALQAVGVVGRLAVLGSRDDHAVPIQNIPRQRSCQIFTCADLA